MQIYVISYVKYRRAYDMPYLPLKMAFYVLFVENPDANFGGCLKYVENSRFAIKRPPHGSHFF